MKSFIVLLDKYHLDQPLFMKVFGQKIRSAKKGRLIILHADNSFTKQLIANGSNPEQALTRATKEINLKLVNLLAEYGIPAISMHGYLKNAISVSEFGDISVDTSFFNQHPDSVATVLSNLAFDQSTEKVSPISVSKLALALKNQLDIDEVLVFAQDEAISRSFIKQAPSEVELLNMIPEEIISSAKGFKLTTIADFDEKNVLESAVSL
ncbi:hypothetical protein EP331_14500 [bacterium]|nr:MAG: hypothetical protein EP331_14500 [bacterium]